MHKQYGECYKNIENEKQIHDNDVKVTFQHLQSRYPCNSDQGHEFS